MSTKASYRPPQGVYALLKDGEVVYIGQSEDIFRRISEHARGEKHGCKKEFDNWWYIECANEDLRLQLETFLIFTVSPKYNLDYNPELMGKMHLNDIYKANKLDASAKDWVNYFQKKWEKFLLQEVRNDKE